MSDLPYLQALVLPPYPSQKYVHSSKANILNHRTGQPPAHIFNPVTSNPTFNTSEAIQLDLTIHAFDRLLRTKKRPPASNTAARSACATPPSCSCTPLPSSMIWESATDSPGFSNPAWKPRPRRSWMWRRRSHSTSRSCRWRSTACFRRPWC